MSEPFTMSASSQAASFDGPVLVGVDGSDTSARALHVAATLASRLNAELVVVHAVGLMSVIDGRHVPSEGRHDELAALLSDRWCQPLAGVEGLRWRAVLVHGPPTEVMLNQADDLAAALVVVGSRGIGSEKLLGSTSHHLVHHCTRPVVVVPPADRSGTD